MGRLREKMNERFTPAIREKKWTPEDRESTEKALAERRNHSHFQGEIEANSCSQ